MSNFAIAQPAFRGSRFGWPVAVGALAALLLSALTSSRSSAQDTTTPVTATAEAPATAAGAPRPNIVFILADDKNEGYCEGIRNCVRIDGNHANAD